MKKLTVKKLALAGVLCCSLGMVGCTWTDDEGWIGEEAPWNTEEVYDDASYEAVPESDVLQEASLFDLVADGCLSEEDECEASDDYLTNQFAQTVTDDPNDTIALSRPAGQKAVSVKEKQAVRARADREKVLYTPQAIPETTTQTEIQVMQAAETVSETPVAVTEVVAPAVVATTAEVALDEPEEVISVSEATATTMIPLKKVKTTITETTTKIKREAPDFDNMSLAERVRYGEDVQEWEATAGSTLRTLLLDWGERSGWTVVWKLDRDYNLEAGVIFRGTFTEVASALVRSFARATPAPIGTFYQGNRVLVISTQEDENER